MVDDHRITAPGRQFRRIATEVARVATRGYTLVPMPRRAKKPQTLRNIRVEAYRAAIRQAAERVFAQRGFAGAHVGQIAKEAGVSVGTIYRAYPGRKQQIYLDLQAQRGKEVLEYTHERGLAAFQRHNDVLDAMLEGLAALVEYFVAHPDYLRIVLSEEKSWAAGPIRGTATQAAMWKQGMSGSEEGMRFGIASGLIVDEDPALMARTLVAMQQAHLGYWLESGGSESAVEVIARLRRQFLRTFCPPEIAAVHLDDGNPHSSVPSSGRKPRVDVQ